MARLTNQAAQRKRQQSMANDTQITVVGNLVGDPEMRFTPSGSAVSNFTIASTPRIFKDGQWSDGETLFLRSSVWRDAAENVAESLTKGMRVIAQGHLKSRSYETKEGEKRTVIEFEIEEIGPSLRYANAMVNRTQRNNNGGGQQQGGQNSQQQGGQWGGNQGQQGGGQWGNQPQDNSQWGNGGADNSPPF